MQTVEVEKLTMPRKSVICKGGVGTGKTHIAIALGFLLRISVKASLKETYHRP